MAGHSEDSALTKSCLERVSSIETKVTERINSLEWQLKKGHKQVNELRRNVEKLVKKTIKKRPPSGKRAESAFFLYLTSIRAELQAKIKSSTDVAKNAGEMWQALSPEEKAVFIEEAERKRKTSSKLGGS